MAGSGFAASSWAAASIIGLSTVDDAASVERRLAELNGKLAKLLKLVEAARTFVAQEGLDTIVRELLLKVGSRIDFSLDFINWRLALIHQHSSFPNLKIIPLLVLTQLELLDCLQVSLVQDQDINFLTF